MKTKSEKICFVIPYLADGGAERVASILSSQLADNGYNVSFVFHHHMPNEYSISDKVSVFSLVDGGRDAYMALSSVKKILLLRKLLKQIKPDYVIPFLPHVAIQVMLAGAGMNFRTIQTLRIAPSEAPKSKIFRLIRDFQVSISYATFVQTESQKHYFPDRVQDKIVVIPNPVSSQMLDKNHQYGSMKRFITVGRLTSQKNFQLAIDAICSVRKQGYDVELDIFGEGEQEKELRKYIQDKKADQFCRLRGRSLHIADEYQKADAFLLTSNFEGMPNALLEAMACGLPCIAADCKTGPKELIGKDRGMLFPVGDLDSLIGCITLAIDEKDRSSSMGLKSKEYIKNNYSPQKIVDSLITNVLRI